MVKTIYGLALVIFILFLFGCDFFMASAFPGYLPSVHRVANLSDYFEDSDFDDYAMFVIDDGPPNSNDFIFLLHKPSATNRKVVVLNGKLDVVSEYEQANLGTLHTRYTSVTEMAVVGSRRMSFDTLTWDIDITTLDTRSDHEIIFNNFAVLYYSFYITNGGVDSVLNWREYSSDFTISANSDSLLIDNSGEYYSIENVGYAVNNTGDPNDDDVILFLRRQSDNECLAVCIPASEFPAGAVSLPLLTNPTHYLGAIKSDSVQIINNGMAVTMDMANGSAKLFEYRGAILGFYEVGNTNDEQFRKKVVAYSYLRPEFYVFDPKTKDLFKCGAWWRN